MDKISRTAEASARLNADEAARTIGKGLSFGAAEAYKMLRTNLSFSLSNNGKCSVIGVTSSLRGEGKSTAAVNIAYTMAETGKMVLLIEGDMRLPVLAKRLGVRQTPGLSNLLAGQNNGNEVMQNSGLLKNLMVITAGAIPPNPAELLDSDNMRQTLQVMRNHFDVVIVDLPPVTAVTDALIVSKLLDGIAVVVRQNYCNKYALDETVRQLRFSKAKLLGFVATDSAVNKKGYYKRYGSNNYYKKRTDIDAL